MDRLNKLERPLKTFDVGGTEVFGDSLGFNENSDIQIHLLNLEYQKVRRANFKSIKGDATNLSQFEDDFF